MLHEGLHHILRRHSNLGNDAYVFFLNVFSNNIPKSLIVPFYGVNGEESKVEEL